jgi:uncharacterized protein
MQKNITIDYQLVKGANHFFKDHMDQLVTSVSSYVDARVGNTANTAARRKAAGAQVS